MKFQSVLGKCSETTLGNLVERCPQTTEVFALHGGNSLQNANLTIAQFAEKYELNPNKLCRQLFDVYMEANPLESMKTEKLLDMIAQDYEASYLEELPKLHRLSRKIEAVHRSSPDLPKGITLLVKELDQMVAQHIDRESQVKESIITKNAAQLPLKDMQKEHEGIKAQLRKIRELTKHYNAPDSACRSWRRLYEELRALDFNMSEQMYLEQEIIFPRLHV